MDIQYDYNEQELDYNGQLENITDTYETYLLELVSVPLVFGLVCIAGILTNGFLLFILLKANAHNATNTFIINLAVGDLLFLLFYLPFFVTAHVMASYPFGEFICKLSESSYWVSTGVSAFTLTALSAHSCLDVTTAPPRSKWSTVVVVAGIWTLAVALATPTMAFAHIWEFPDVHIAVCMPHDHEYFTIRSAIRFAVYVAIPVAVVGCLYLFSRRNRDANLQTRARKDFANTALVLFAVYAVCSAPKYVFHWLLDFHIGDYDLFWHTLRLATYFMNNVCHCLNPVALYCISGSFRQLFNGHLLCWCKPKGRGPGSDLELTQQIIEPES